MAENGARFYGLALNSGTVQITEETWQVPESFPLADTEVSDTFSLPFSSACFPFSHYPPVAHCLHSSPLIFTGCARQRWRRVAGSRSSHRINLPFWESTQPRAPNFDFRRGNQTKTTERKDTLTHTHRHRHRHTHTHTQTQTHRHTQHTQRNTLDLFVWTVLVTFTAAAGASQLKESKRRLKVKSNVTFKVKAPHLSFAGGRHSLSPLSSLSFLSVCAPSLLSLCLLTLLTLLSLSLSLLSLFSLLSLLFLLGNRPSCCLACRWICAESGRSLAKAPWRHYSCEC